MEGNWMITIAGTGPHHSSDPMRDADLLAKELGEKLRAAGHSVALVAVVAGRGDLSERLERTAFSSLGDVSPIDFAPEELEQAATTLGVAAGLAPGDRSVGPVVDWDGTTEKPEA